MEKSAVIIINPSSGREKALEYEEKIKSTIKIDYPNLSVKYTEGEGDATRFAGDAGENRIDLVVSVGGDGTVNEIVNGLAGFENPPILGIIPLGTVNDFARSFNIPFQPEEAIELLIKGVQKKADIGIANDKYFTNILGVGNPVEAVHNVDSDEKLKIGSLAYVKAIASEMLDDTIFPIRLEMDEIDWEGNVAVLLVALIDSLGGMKFILSDVDKGDGNFHIFAIEKLNIPELINMAPSLILGDISNSENVKYFKSKNLKIRTLNHDYRESDIDGEKGPELPLELKVLPKHLTIISGIDDEV